MVNKEWVARYLLPLTGLFLTLLLSLVIVYLPGRVVKADPEVGFKEIPYFVQMTLTPFTLPIGSLCLCALFVGAAFAPSDATRAALNATAFILLLFFAIFWTYFIAWTIGVAQMGEMFRARDR